MPITTFVQTCPIDSFLKLMANPKQKKQSVRFFFFGLGEKLMKFVFTDSMKTLDDLFNKTIAKPQLFLSCHSQYFMKRTYHCQVINLISRSASNSI